MFNDNIMNTPFQGELMREYIGKKIRLIGTPLHPDASLHTSLISLLYRRIPEGDCLHYHGFSTCDSSAGEENLRYTDTVTLLRTVLREYEAENYTGTDFIIISTSGENYIDKYKEQFCNWFTGFSHLERIAEFFKGKLSIACFISPETKTTVLIGYQLEKPANFHHMQSALLAMFPWYFQADKTCTQNEKDLMESLLCTTPQRYLEAINRIYKEDFYDAFLKRALQGFEVKGLEATREQTLSAIEDKRAEINYLEEQHRQRLKEHSDLLLKLESITLAMQNACKESAMAEYFACNRSLQLENIRQVGENFVLDFFAQGHFVYYDEDAAERVIDNPHSNLYRYLTSEEEKQDMRELLYEIFIHRTLRMKTCATYRLISYSGAMARKWQEFPEDYKHCMPNPHIQGYACMGNHALEVNHLVAEGKYIEAVEQCVASAQSLNFLDGTVMDLFAEVLCGKERGYNNVCIELPDGRVVNPKQAIKFIKEGGLR